MNMYDFAPIRALITGAYWLVTAIEDALAPLAGTASAALAIVLLTIAVRIVLIPVGVSQAKAGIARQRLAPKLAELQRRYRQKPDVLQRKTMELYAAEKTSPLAGCMPVLAQTPVLMAVYALFILPAVAGHANELLSHTFLGVPLGARLVGEVSAGAATGGTVAVFVAIMAVIAVVAGLSRRFLTPPSAPGQALASPAPSGQPGVPDLSGLTKLLSFMPFMTAVVAAFVPLAAALYLMTTTTWALGERVVLRRLLTPDAAAAGPDTRGEGQPATR